ncbi:NAD(P)-dependent dehydrogenase, short-chain alcohol dehydrogenase family [Sphingomonas laterariae]|uniref:NAD(P)-dependent dehydrogenase, short-chain alcohol dehydrogenase family n=1 Tax=Edaphosphingomonas laterariae TaxID=861865 RepID=A0A239BDA8_9SPHN|nr:SDR family NAD(P)-dependent oxidoreductase [Sphingomonas laterariae]SNS05084.1 NAD(P)-dependent dehydrogenase, short-chain alcohol dehydrogenase family [Sphingomonas laterariae]
MNRMTGKIVLVTGAASGIGRASAVRLASEGAIVVCADRNLAGAEETAAQLPGASAVEFDAASAEACRKVVDHVIAKHGKLDVLCNIAGIGGFGHAAQIADEEWDRLVAINLSSIFHLSKAALPHLEKTQGNIVNMSSASGLVGAAYASAYSATKAGVVGYTRTVAIEYASRQVRVNAICPGGVDTPLIAGGAVMGQIEGIDFALVARMSPKMAPLARPEDVAAAVAFLASDDARFITGIMLPVDGGQTAG